MKQITILALTLAVLAGGLGSKALGIALFSLQPCTTTAAPGTRFTVLVNVTNNVDSIYAWSYVLYWDTLVLRCDTIIKGPWLSRNGQDATIFVVDTVGTRGGADVGEAKFWPAPFTRGDGTLARMVFFVRRQGFCSIRFDTTFPRTCLSTLDSSHNAVPTRVATKNGYFETPSGVEEKGQGGLRGQDFRIMPNPFSSFAAVFGNPKGGFAVYDISGRLIRMYRGERFGEDLAPGVYFLVPEDRSAKPVRIVKLR